MLHYKILPHLTHILVWKAFMGIYTVHN